MYDLWSYRPMLGGLGGAAVLAGYRVEATDGSIGSVDEVNDEAGCSHIVAGSGRGILHKQRMLPAGTIKHIDHDQRTIYIDRDKEEIKAAPRYHEQLRDDAGFQTQLSDYYGRAGM